MLIVEDQDSMRRMLREYLQSAYPDDVVMEAADGAGALELCRSRRPQLVMMDVGLPDVNGIDLIPRIRQLLPGTEVIVVSQHDNPVYVERARAAGAFAYVTKNRIFQELLPEIGRALGRDRPDEDIETRNV